MITEDFKILNMENESRCGDTTTLWSCKMISRNGFRVIRWRQRIHRKQCRVHRDPFRRDRSRTWFTHTAQTVLQKIVKLVKIHSGIMTQAHLIAQRRTEWQKEPSAEWQKEQLSQSCKADHQKNGGIVRWNTVVTCATCTTRCPMTWQSTSQLPRKTSQEYIKLERKRWKEYSWALFHVRREVSQVISHVMSGTIVCVCSTLAISALSPAWKRCRKEHKKMEVKKESQHNVIRWRI